MTQGAPAEAATGSALRRLFGRVRPLEWVLLAFLAFVAVKAGRQALVEWKEILWVRTRSILFALLFIEVLSLVCQVFGEWPAQARSARRLHLLLLPMVSAPLWGGAFLIGSNPLIVRDLVAAPASRVVSVTVTLVLHVVGMCLPPLTLWALAGLDLRSHGHFSARRVLGGTARFLLESLRDWTPLLVLLAGYWWSSTSPDVPVEGRDALMESFDRALFFGRDPFELLRPVISRPLSEWLAFAYSFYAVLFPLVLGAVRFARGRAALQELSFALGLAFFAAYLSYDLIPVKGPALSRAFDVDLHLYLLAPVKEALMDATRVDWDCFPSMHTCATLLLGWAARRHSRALFILLLPVLVSIPVACVYLRYHWVADVLAGIALAGLVVTVTRFVGLRWGGGVFSAAGSSAVSLAAAAARRGEVERLPVPGAQALENTEDAASSR